MSPFSISLIFVFQLNWLKWTSWPPCPNLLRLHVQTALHTYLNQAATYCRLLPIAQL